ncbi:MAG: PAS domain S-box protein [Rhodospirillales bacterium]|nr:PAS domain S-box protein [Rhodospirillales bacterium]
MDLSIGGARAVSKDENLDYKALFFEMPFPRFFLTCDDEKSCMKVVECNNAALAYFKQERGNIIGKTLMELLDPESLGSFRNSIQKILEQKKPVSMELINLPGAANGIGGFYAIPRFCTDGSVQFIDMTAYPADQTGTSIERERDDAISLLTSVFDVSEVGIVVTDGNQRIVRVNDSFVRIYGWGRDELIGHSFTDFIAPEERERSRLQHEEFIRSGIRASGEMKLSRKDGNVANALFTTAAIDLSHARRFQVTTIMDITLRKQMEHSLRLAKEQADAANQAKSTFLANMSHELRTPLNAIIGFSEIIMNETFGPLGNEKYKEYLGDVHLSARHLLEIINEVLDMSKIEAGRVELDEEIFNVGQLIDSVVRMMASRAFSGGLEINGDIMEDLPPLYADPRLVRQVLINLAGNAIKFSRPGGKVTIRAFLTARGEMELVVADTGIGIPPEKIKDAMEPFSQVNKPVISSGLQGTGLGLPLSKAMVELHGGTLDLQSDEGRGTTVVVKLPADRVRYQTAR